MPPRRGDLQGPLYVLLALHLGEIGFGKLLRPGGPGQSGGDQLLPLQMGDKLAHRLHGVDHHPFGEGGLWGGVGGDKETAYPGLLGSQRHGQHPGDAAKGSGQGKLPHKGAVPLRTGKLASGGEDPYQNRKVVDRAALFPVGRGQVHRDAGDRELEPAVFHRRAHPVPGLLYGGVGEPHNVKVGKPAGQVALTGHFVALHPAKA